ncbi:hypothetical protein P4J12_30085 [Bacillus cereus]|nr:hypothetical protein [Bacillus cereus]
MCKQIDAETLSNWEKNKTSRTAIERQINNPEKSIHSGAFYF